MFSVCLEDGEDEDDKDQNAEQLKSPKSPKKHRKMVEISSNGKIEDKWLPHVAFQMEKAILVDVEELEEKLCSASLQSKVTTSGIYFDLKEMGVAFGSRVGIWCNSSYPQYASDLKSIDLSRIPF